MIPADKSSQSTHLEAFDSSQTNSGPKMCVNSNPRGHPWHAATTSILCAFLEGGLFVKELFDGAAYLFYILVGQEGG